MAKKKSGRRTSIERLEELKEELDLEKKKKRKKGKKVSNIIDIKKMSKHKKKKLKKRLSPKASYVLSLYTKEEKEAFWYNYELSESIYNHEESEERWKRIWHLEEERDRVIDKKLEDVDIYDLDDVIKVEKIIETAYEKRYKKFKKYGYEIGEDDVFYINEDKIIKNLKKNAKDVSKINERFKEFLEKTMGNDANYASRLNKSTLKVDKNVKNLLESFETIAYESSLFRFK